MNTMQDVVIIGGGAAGLTAGIVLARAQARVLVIDSGEPRNAPAAHMYGFLSRDGMPPAALLNSGREEFVSYNGQIVTARVTAAERLSEEAFRVALDDGTTISTRAILVATGLVDQLPDIPGLRDLWGVDVHHCPHCHGYEVLGEAIAVVGGDMRPMSLHQAALLRRYSDDMIFFPNRIELTSDEREQLVAIGVRIIDGQVTAIRTANGRLAGVELADGSVTPRTAVFVGPRPLPRDLVLRELGCVVDEVTGSIQVDGTGATSVAGVWAAGNVVNSRAQVIAAAGAGSAAGIAITSWLVQHDLTAVSRLS
jgi:thioredoxin reductase